MRFSNDEEINTKVLNYYKEANINLSKIEKLIEIAKNKYNNTEIEKLTSSQKKNKYNKELLELIDCDDFRKEYVLRGQSHIERTYHFFNLNKFTKENIQRTKENIYTSKVIFNLINYGVENQFQSEKTKEKSKRTNLSKLGVEYPGQSLECHRKAQETMLERYGDKNYNQKKCLDRTLEIYGSRINVERANETKLKKYGNLNNFEKIKKTMFERYDSEYSFSSPIIRKKLDNIFQKHYGGISPFCNKNIYEKGRIKIKNTPKEIKHSWVIKRCETIIENGGELTHSHYETELKELLGEDFKPNRSILNGLEIDLYNEKLKLGIEFNGTFWHSSLKKPKDYHLKKSIACREKGIRLIHIYEFEDFEKQKELLKELVFNGNDLYLKNDFNKNNLITKNIPTKPYLIYNKNGLKVYGAGKLY